MGNTLIMYPPPGYGYTDPSPPTPSLPWSFETPSGSSWTPPSTNTQGLKEALAYAKDSRWQFRCEGGQDNNSNTYTILWLGEPLSIGGSTPGNGPGRSAFTQFNGVHLAFIEGIVGDLFNVDSQMITETEFNGGEITGHPLPGHSVVRLWPVTPNVPGDPVLGIGSCRLKFPAISTLQPGGIAFRCTPGSGNSGISSCLIEIGEINGGYQAGSQGLLVDPPASTGTFSNNTIRLIAGIHGMQTACNIGPIASGANQGAIFTNKWELKIYPAPQCLALGTYAKGDVYDVQIEGDGSPGQTGVVDMIGPNIFRGIIKSVANPFPYSRPGSQSSGLLVF